MKRSEALIRSERNFTRTSRRMMGVHDNRNTIYNTVQRGRPQHGHLANTNTNGSFQTALLYFDLRKQTRHAKDYSFTGQNK